MAVRLPLHPSQAGVEEFERRYEQILDTLQVVEVLGEDVVVAVVAEHNNGIMVDPACNESNFFEVFSPVGYWSQPRNRFEVALVCGTLGGVLFDENGEVDLGDLASESRATGCAQLKRSRLAPTDPPVLLVSSGRADLLNTSCPGSNFPSSFLAPGLTEPFGAFAEFLQRDQLRTDTSIDAAGAGGSADAAETRTWREFVEFAERIPYALVYNDSVGIRGSVTIYHAETGPIDGEMLRLEYWSSTRHGTKLSLVSVVNADGTEAQLGPRLAIKASQPPYDEATAEDSRAVRRDYGGAVDFQDNPSLSVGLATTDDLATIWAFVDASRR